MCIHLLVYASVHSKKEYSNDQKTYMLIKGVIKKTGLDSYPRTVVPQPQFLIRGTPNPLLCRDL